MECVWEVRCEGLGVRLHKDDKVFVTMETFKRNVAIYNGKKI